MNQLLHAGFLRSAEHSPQLPALVVEGHTLSYGELGARAAAIAATIQERVAPGEPLVAVLAERTATAFAGVLGALLAGRGYVPLNPTYPVSRTGQMLRRSRSAVVVVDRHGEALAGEVLEGLEGFVVIAPDRDDVSDLSQRLPSHIVLGRRALAPAGDWRPVPTESAAPAYLLFTSGSTGVPRGVMVTHANAAHFVRNVLGRYDLGSRDRCSQMFDLTFDLSVFDMFVAWTGGACVCCPPRAELWNPGAFIREQQLTLWFSVPSVVTIMRRLGALKPGVYPTLRWSLFCGEPLLADAAASWASAAPSSVVENLYGPTELTVACTTYRWDPLRSPAECEHGVVPIGQPLPGMRALIVDEGLVEVLPGQIGELLMDGPQRTGGYWGDDAATARAHVRVPGHEGAFYRTGDLVRQTPSQRSMTFHGRVDHQVKIGGHRIELGEIESTLLALPGVESAAALPCAAAVPGLTQIAAFITGRDIEVASVRSGLRARLQEYAVPQTIRVLPSLPLNANGKVDRTALATLLAE